MFLIQIQERKNERFISRSISGRGGLEIWRRTYFDNFNFRRCVLAVGKMLISKSKLDVPIQPLFPIWNIEF
jgi:hypothetical protein